MSTTVSSVSNSYSTSTQTKPKAEEPQKDQVQESTNTTKVEAQDGNVKTETSNTSTTTQQDGTTKVETTQQALSTYGQAQVSIGNANSAGTPAKAADAEAAPHTHAADGSAAPATATATATPAANAAATGTTPPHDHTGEPVIPREVNKVATTSKDWEEISLHLAAKGDKTDFKATDVTSHIDHHIDDGKTLHAIGADEQFTADERKFAEEKAAGQDKYATVMSDMNRYFNFYGKDGVTDTAKATEFAKQFEMYDGKAGISDDDRAKADAVAKEQGIALQELGNKGHSHPPAPPTTKEGEVLMEDVLKTYRNIDKFNAQNVKEGDITKLVDGNQKMVDLLKKASDLGYKEKDPTFKSGVEDLDKKAKKNVSTGNYLKDNFQTLAGSDDNLASLSADELKMPNKDNDAILRPDEVSNQRFDNSMRLLNKSLDMLFPPPSKQTQPPVQQPPAQQPPAKDTTGNAFRNTLNHGYQVSSQRANPRSVRAADSNVVNLNNQAVGVNQTSVQRNDNVNVRVNPRRVGAPRNTERRNDPIVMQRNSERRNENIVIQRNDGQRNDTVIVQRNSERRNDQIVMPPAPERRNDPIVQQDVNNRQTPYNPPVQQQDFFNMFRNFMQSFFQMFRFAQ